MKANTFKTIIAVALSALIGYGFYAFWRGESHTDIHLATTAIALLYSLVTLVISLGLRFQTDRATLVIRSTSIVFFLVGFLTLILISVFTTSVPGLIITMGLISLVYALIVYSVMRSGQ
jgi:hypothetical protein